MVQIIDGKVSGPPLNNLKRLLGGIPVPLENKFAARATITTDPGKFWAQISSALTDTKNFGIGGQGNFIDATHEIPQIIENQLKIADLANRPQDIEYFLHHGEWALQTIMAKYSTPKTYNPTVLQGIQYVYRELLDGSIQSNPKIKPGVDLFWWNKAFNPERRAETINQIQQSIGNEVIGVNKCMPFVGKSSSMLIWASVIDHMNHQLPNADISDRRAYIRDMEIGCKNIFKDPYVASEYPTQREAGEYLAKVINAKSNDGQLMKQEAIDLCVNDSEINLYWSRLIGDICNLQYGAEGAAGTSVYPALIHNAERLARTVQSTVREPAQVRFLKIANERVLGQKQITPQIVALTTLQDTIDKGFNVFPSAQIWREQELVTNPQAEIKDIVLLLTSNQTGIGTQKETQSVGTAQQRWTRFIDAAEKEHVPTKTKKGIFEAIQKELLVAIEGATDLKVIAELSKMYGSAIIDSKEGRSDLKTVTQAYIDQKVTDICKEGALDSEQQTAINDKLSQYELVDIMANGMKKDWKEYFEHLRNPIYGKGQAAQDLSDIFQSVQEAKLVAIANKDFAFSGAYLKAGMLAIFDEWKDTKNRNRGDYKNRLVFTALHLLANSPIAKKLEEREGTGESQKATATIRDIQTWFVAQMMENKDLQSIILPYIEQKLNKPKDPKEVLLWITHAFSSRDKALQMIVKQKEGGKAALLTPSELPSSFIAAYTASIENVASLLAGGNADEAKLELLAAWRNAFPMVIAAQGNLLVRGRTIKDLRKPGQGNKNKAKALKYLDATTSVNMIDTSDNIFYRYWEGTGKAPDMKLIKGASLPMKLKITQTLNDGYTHRTANEGKPRNMLEYLLMMTEDVCQKIDVPGYSSLGRNYGEWELSTRINLVSRLVQVTEQVILGEQFNNKTKQGNESIQNFAASMLYTMGLALKEWQSEDPRIKNILAQSMNVMLVKILGNEGKSESEYCTPVTQMAWEVIEQFVPYWSKEHRGQFLDAYMSAAIRNISLGGLNQFANNGKLFKLMRLLAIRSDDELPPVQNEQIQFIPGEHSTTGIRIRPNIEEELRPIIFKILNSYSAWYTQDRSKRLYKVLPNDIFWNGDESKMKDVGELSIVGQMLRLSEAIMPNEERQKLVDSTMQEVLNQRAQAFKMTSISQPFLMGAIERTADIIQALVSSPTRMMNEVADILKQATPLLTEQTVSINEQGELMVQGLAQTPGNTPPTTTLKIFKADESDPIGQLQSYLQAAQGAQMEAATKRLMTPADLARYLQAGEQSTSKSTVKDVSQAFKALFGGNVKTKKKHKTSKNTLEESGMSLQGDYSSLILLLMLKGREEALGQSGFGQAIASIMQAGVLTEEQIFAALKTAGILESSAGATVPIFNAVGDAIVHTVQNADKLGETIGTMKLQALNNFQDIMKQKLEVITSFYERLNEVERQKQSDSFEQIKAQLALEQTQKKVQIDLVYAAMEQMAAKLGDLNTELAPLISRIKTVDFAAHKDELTSLIGLVDPESAPYKELWNTRMALYIATGLIPAVTPVNMEELGIKREEQKGEALSTV